MKATLPRRLVFSLSFLLTLSCCLSSTIHAAPFDPGAPDYSGRKGKTLLRIETGRQHRRQQLAEGISHDPGGFVGRAGRPRRSSHHHPPRHLSWRPGSPRPTKAPPGAYNLLIGDCDGSLGSGAVGRVVIDSSDPEKGFKSADSWTTVLSSMTWDRWKLRNLYATGGDAGLFWDFADKSGEAFTVIVEDCVGIGRAFGGGFGYSATREEEPIVFRRCYLMCFDWGAGAGALGVAAPP